MAIDLRKKNTTQTIQSEEKGLYVNITTQLVQINRSPNYRFKKAIITEHYNDRRIERKIIESKKELTNYINTL